MNETFDALATRLAGWLADYYLAAGLLMAVVGMAWRWIRQPAHRVAVGWTTVLELLVLAAACLLPIWPKIPLRTDAPQSPSAQSPLRAIETESPPMATFPRESRRNLPADATATPPPAPEESQPLPAAAPAAVPTPWTWTACVAACFLAGASLTLVRLGWGALAAAWIVRRATPAGVAAHAELKRIVGPSRPRPRLLTSSQIGNAVALGILRPTIVLPVRLADAADGSPAMLRAVLQHEMAHLRHRDLWLLALGRALSVALYAHPLFWWLRRAIRGDQELRADAAAAGDNRHDYAEELVRLVRLAGKGDSPIFVDTKIGTVPLSAAVGIWESPASLSRRILTLLDDTFRVHPTGSRRWCVKALAVMLVLGAVCSLVTLQPGHSTAEPQEPTTKSEQAEEAGQSPSVQTVRVAGTCVDQERRPIADVEVSLYEEVAGISLAISQKTRTDATGKFAFSPLNLNIPSGDEDVRHFLLVAKAKGKARAYSGFHTETVRNDVGRLELKMEDARTITGRVVDENDKPIAGAAIGLWPTDPNNPACLVVTDAEGRFETTEVPRLGGERRRGFLSASHPEFRSTLRPEFGFDVKVYEEEPNIITFRLARHSARIEGRVIDTVTGKPAARVSVRAWGLLSGQDTRRERNDESTLVPPTAPATPVVGGPGPNDEPPPAILQMPPPTGPAAIAGAPKPVEFAVDTTTDAEGRYRLPLEPGKYTLWATQKGRTVRAIESFEIKACEKRSAPDLRLIEGGLVEGQVVDARTGHPIQRTKDDLIVGITWHGPSRPLGTMLSEFCSVRGGGSFCIRLAPGKNYAKFSFAPGSSENPSGMWEVVPDASFDGNGRKLIEVVEGQTTKVDFHVRWNPDKVAKNKNVITGASGPVRPRKAGSPKKAASPDTPAATQGKPVAVARITGMVAVRWTDPSLAPSIQMISLGQKIALGSGLLEITYNTGTKLILQGPCDYTVDSKTGGYLKLGKLTVRVEQKGEGGRGKAEPAVSDQGPLAAGVPASAPQPPAPLFSLRTPAAIIAADLGAEFGTEVDAKGMMQSQVFSGEIRFTGYGSGKPEDRQTTVPAGHSIHLAADNHAAGSSVRVAVILSHTDDSMRKAAAAFVRQMPRPKPRTPAPAHATEVKHPTPDDLTKTGSGTLTITGGIYVSSGRSTDSSADLECALWLPGYELLGEWEVVKELGLSDEQKRKLQAIQEKCVAENAQRSRGMESLGPQEREKAAKAFNQWYSARRKSIPKEVEQVLTPQQMKTFKELYLRIGAFTRLHDPDVLKKLGVDPRQEAKLGDIYVEAGDRMRSDAKRRYEKAMAVLTAGQREKVREAVLGPLGPDYHATLFVAVAGEPQPIPVPSPEPYPDFGDPGLWKNLGLNQEQQKQVRDILGGSKNLTERLAREYLATTKKKDSEGRTVLGTENSYAGAGVVYDGTLTGVGTSASTALSAEEIKRQQAEMREKMKTERQKARAEYEKQPLVKLSIELRKRFEAVLTPSQREAYREMALKAVADFALSDPLVESLAGLHDDQIAILARLPHDTSKTFHQLGQEMGRRALDVLTPAQKAALPDVIEQAIEAQSR
jgi:hypothetical protein